MIEAPVFDLQQDVKNLYRIIDTYKPNSLHPDEDPDNPDRYAVSTLEYFGKLPHTNGGISLLSPTEQAVYKSQAIEETEYFICDYVASSIWDELHNYYTQPSNVEQYIQLAMNNLTLEEAFDEEIAMLHNMQISPDILPAIIGKGYFEGISSILEQLTPDPSIPLQEYRWEEAPDVMLLKYDEDRSEWYGQMETNIPGVLLESVYREGSEMPALLLIIKPTILQD